MTAEPVYRLAYNGDVAAGQLAVFRGASEAPISGFIRVERATRKNSQLTAARRVALKMGRRLRCSSVTYRLRYAPSTASPARTALPVAHLNATTSPLYARRYTCPQKHVRRPPVRANIREGYKVSAPKTSGHIALNCRDRLPFPPKSAQSAESAVSNSEFRFKPSDVLECDGQIFTQIVQILDTH